MKALKEILNENNRVVSFELFQSNLIVGSDRNLYKEISSKYDLLAAQATVVFEKYFNEIKNIDELFGSIYDVFLMSLENVFNEICKDAISIEIYSCDIERIMNYCFSNNYFDSFERTVKLFQEEDDEIISSLNNGAKYREIRKNTRSKWQAVSFGGSMLDAWSAKMKAGTMNAVEGLGHSFINSIGNTLDEMNAEEKRSELFRNSYYRNRFVSCFTQSARNLKQFIIDLLGETCNIDADGEVLPECENEAKAIFNNLSRYDFPDDQKKQLLLKIFDLDPFNPKYYEYALEHYFENAKEIIAIADFFEIEEIKPKIKEIFSKYVDNNIGETEESALKCQDEVRRLHSEIAPNIDITDIFNRIEKKLVEIDIAIRTVSGVTFKTREEAASAKNDVEQNKDVLDKDDYVCVHDYCDHIKKIKDLSIHPDLISEHVSRVKAKREEFEEKCRKALRHQYRLEHNNTILWSNNSGEMVWKYAVVVILAILTFVFVFNSKYVLSILFGLTTIVTFYGLFVSAANKSENIWCEVTKKGRYLLSDVMNSEKRSNELSESDSEYQFVSSKKSIICLLCGFIFITTGLYYWSYSGLSEHKNANDEKYITSVSSKKNSDYNHTTLNRENEKIEIEYRTLEESNQFEIVGLGSENSRKALTNYLPELYNELSVAMDKANFDDNSFSICDIDFDGEAELLVKIITGSTAANAIYIYDIDGIGNVVRNGSVSAEAIFYKNGMVKSPLNHNQGKGRLWPYVVKKYNSSEDVYINNYDLDSWDKSLYPKGFPYDTDVSSTGTVYLITDYYNKSVQQVCDYSDYVKWFNSWNQCSPQLQINYEAFSEDNIKKYNPDWNTIKETETVSVNKSEARPSLDVDDSVTASYNSDGTIKIEYTSVPMTMTVPSSWAGKFVIRNGSFLARTSYYNKTGGKLIPIVMRDEYNDSGGNGRYIGKAGYKYCFYFYASDLNYDMDNAEEASEYESLRPDIETVLQSAVCIPYEDKITADIVNLKPYLTGQISSGGKTIEGYTTDYVCHGAEQSVEWICEDTWNITARRKTSSYGVEWYECWDTDDGDYYGWIDGKFLYFY